MGPARAAVAAALAAVAASPAGAQPALSSPDVHISRTAGDIRIDGDLSDEGWRTATRVEKWYEIEPGDNVEPPVKSVGHLAYDDRFVYVGLDFQDTEPGKIRAPLGDHDAISGISMDFGGVFIDSLDTGRSAVEFFVTAGNVQYDAVTDDASG